MAKRRETPDQIASLFAVEVRAMGDGGDWYAHSSRLTRRGAAAVKADLERPFNGEVRYEARIVPNRRAKWCWDQPNEFIMDAAQGRAAGRERARAATDPRA